MLLLQYKWVLETGFSIKSDRFFISTKLFIFGQPDIVPKALYPFYYHIHRVISDIMGKTGLKIIRAILAGTRNPQKLASFKDGRIRRTTKEIATIFLLTCSLILTISIPLSPTKLAAQSPQGINLIQQGIELYQAEQFEKAIAIWDTALNQEDDNLVKSFILSNLSLAYQNLGRWQAAEKSITESLDILDGLHITTQTDSEILAKALNSQGHLQWLKGDFDRAIATWELAAKNYLEAGNTASAIKCKLNQTKALQTAGLSSKAQETLAGIDRDLKQTSNLELKITGLQYLGNVLRHVGDLQKSEQVLQSSLKIAESNETLLELGNTERALSDSYVATNQPELAERYAQAAISHYQQAFNQGNNLKAGLNQLSLAIALGKWSDITKLIPQIERYLAKLPANKSGVIARFNFSRSLSCLKEINENNNLVCVPKVRRDQLEQILSQQQPALKTPDWEQIVREVSVAIELAPDNKTKSYGMGELGRIYESQQQWQLAKKHTEQALLILEGINAPEIRYLWEWQLGRIFKQQGNISAAITNYGFALQNLKSVRSDLLIVNSEAQFSFRDNTEPLYREFVDLLLQSDRAREVTQEHLAQAIQSIDSLQLSEIENFLNCDLTSTLQLDRDTRNLDNIDVHTGFIYPIMLEDRLEVIFKLPGQPIEYHTNLVSQDVVKQTLRELKTAIVRGYAGQAISSSQIVYDWLIKPWEKYLESSDSEASTKLSGINPRHRISTLVFVLDGELRNIPMSVLYDSQRQEYLVQKHYALALLPSFQAFDLQTVSSELQVLGAGISQELQVENKSFSGLQVTEELANIRDSVASSILLNAEFTQSNIQKNLDRGDFSVVHLATHGNFSSNPEETYILVYDSDTSKGSLLKARDLDRLLRHNSNQKPIELLVLSACETAEGDDRAALGLAGLAIRAGAQSTLATLWQVNDRSTIKFMERFYQELNIPGTSKAIALHRAQQDLLSKFNYQAPYYWSPYILVGNWK